MHSGHMVTGAHAHACHLWEKGGWKGKNGKLSQGHPGGAGSLLTAAFTFQLVIEVPSVVNVDMFNVNSGFYKLKMSTLSYACI